MVKKYDYYNIANIARLLTELPDEDLKEVMFMIEYKRKRNEEKIEVRNFKSHFYFSICLNSSKTIFPSSRTIFEHSSKVSLL